MIFMFFLQSPCSKPLDMTWPKSLFHMCTVLVILIRVVDTFCVIKDL